MIWSCARKLGTERYKRPLQDFFLICAARIFNYSIVVGFRNTAQRHQDATTQLRKSSTLVLACLSSRDSQQDSARDYAPEKPRLGFPCCCQQRVAGFSAATPIQQAEARRRLPMRLCSHSSTKVQVETPGPPYLSQYYDDRRIHQRFVGVFRDSKFA